MIAIDLELEPSGLSSKIEAFWKLSASKIRALDRDPASIEGIPVFTVGGRYSSQTWTDWTQGFELGSWILQFDATDDAEFLDLGRKKVLDRMPPHLTNMGVHDHGFNNVSTYGNLMRLQQEGRIGENTWELRFYQLALKCSAAVQARRWSQVREGGYIYSFNGPHSLFVDTIRSLRSLALGHRLGHSLIEENGTRVSLLERLLTHARTTAAFNVYYGAGRDTYDVPGRVAHESIFNLIDGSYRCPSSQQGFSPFTTWTRGLAWIMCGYAELLEFLDTIDPEILESLGGWESNRECMLRAARVSCDYYIENTPSDGIPYWDTGAPSLHKLGDYLNQPALPLNDWEPVDSSAAAIAAQGLLRLGHYLKEQGETKDGNRYWQAGLTVLDTLLSEPYLSLDPNHQGLILHSIYHRPRGWDFSGDGERVPSGESSMWGDYHAREIALYVQRLATRGTYLTFWGDSSPLA